MRSATLDKAEQSQHLKLLVAFTGMPAPAIWQAFEKYNGVAAFDRCVPPVELISEYDTEGREFREVGFMLLPCDHDLYAAVLPVDWLFAAKRDEPAIGIAYQGVTRGMVLSPAKTTGFWALQLFCRYAPVTRKLSDGSLVISVWDNQGQKNLWQSPAFFDGREKQSDLFKVSMATYRSQAQSLLNSRYRHWQKPWKYWEEAKNGQPDHRGSGWDWSR